MRIAGVKISHFRGIEHCEFTLGEDDSLICLIGQGDSTKTTILTAIQWVLWPTRNLGVEDQDFYLCDVECPIAIEVAVRCLPEDLLAESEFGFYLTDAPAFQGETDPVEERSPCLTVRLTVRDDLYPEWEVYKGERSKKISFKSRAFLGASTVFGTAGDSLTWSRGSDLRRLAASEAEINRVLVDAVRRLGGTSGFTELDRPLEALADDLDALGVALDDGKLSTQMLVHRARLGMPLALFDGGVPVERKGAGTRKLVDAAIGMGLTEAGAILLVDEIEVGLEPHRLRGLLRALRSKAISEDGQVIVTTHSPVTITELDEFELATVHCCNGETSVYRMAERCAAGNELVRKKLKANSEAFLANRIIVCEGKTELGVVRSLDECSMAPLALNGVSPLDARGGDEMFTYAKLLYDCGYGVCIFMDSDEQKYEAKKTDARNSGIPVFDWDCGLSTEGQVFKDLPDVGVRELIEATVVDRGEDSVRDRLGKFGLDYGQVSIEGYVFTDEDRVSLAKAAGCSKRGETGWFKRIDSGEKLGAIVVNSLGEISGTRLASTLTELAKWVRGE